MRDLPIAEGGSCYSKSWKNKIVSFDSIKQKLRNTKKTAETAAEYAKMTGKEREKAKDHGGFVGGVLNGGRRLIENVQSRSIISLDGDYVPKDFLTFFKPPYAAVLYSTHSHTPQNPRYRIVIPLTRDVSPEEYVAVARYTAADIGIEYFDSCSFTVNQLMYYPSTPSDVQFVYEEYRGAWLDPDAVLSAHPDWTDSLTLPRSSMERKATTGEKVADPLTKEGVVGAFCRTYFPISKVVDKYLSDVYEETGRENRYLLKGSKSVAGVEVIEDKFVYSHHAKDPANQRLCNAFDLVRIHKFGDTDKSFNQMCEFAVADVEVTRRLDADRLAEAEADFKDDPNWKDHLEKDKNGRAKNTLQNAIKILEWDPNLKGIVFNQLADGMEIQGEVPWKHPAKFWRDVDDAQLEAYIDKYHGSFSKQKLFTAVTKVSDDRSYHPIKDMFDALPEWDGVPRVETLFVDYLGAEDSEYTRTITRKIFCAAYRRVYEPGIKFDTMLVLVGDQGQGKSSLISMLGGEWYTDSIQFSDMNDKAACEKILGYWLVEFSELAGIRKMDIERAKAFISTQNDRYRAAYGRRVEPHPRQCVFFGTTNKTDGYLRDITGNRRFWNLNVSGEGKYTPWDVTDEYVKQFWAEVKVKANDESLYLTPELEAVARDEQRKAMEYDEREGIVEEFLEMKLPEDWYELDAESRANHFKAYMSGNEEILAKGKYKREYFSGMEIWNECFGKYSVSPKKSDFYDISAIVKRIGGWEQKRKVKRIFPYGSQRVYERV